MLETEPADAAVASEPLETSRKSEHGSFFALTLGSIGVVYGDIGTSPLYAFREALRPMTADGLARSEVLGLASLLIWALTVIVSIKYVAFLLRADNRGEGGMLALLALVQKKMGTRTTPILLLGLAGCALFFGDAIITPAISVLSSVEGLKLVTPAFTGYVEIIAIAILITLFAIQMHGTSAVAAWFGPMTAIWFLVLAGSGIAHIVAVPDVLWAFNPVHAVSFLFGERLLAFVVLGAVFLAVTGAEALYADLGHFGRAPIQTAWFVLVFPALALNYLGQAALVLSQPDTIADPFFRMFPGWMLLPAVVLATMATIIASQAVITGAFSLTRQAIQLGFVPRMEVRHTSQEQTGQIYMPRVNMLLLLGVLVLVVVFRSSDALATAYGIAVTGTMIVTTILAYAYLRHVRSWSMLPAFVAVLPFAVVEIVFLAANMTKFFEGGYLPVIVASVLFVTMWTWTRGAALLAHKTGQTDVRTSTFAASIEKQSEHGPTLVPGTAIFFTSDPETVPTALLHNLKHNHVLHEQNVILTVHTAPVPVTSPERRVRIEPISKRFVRLDLTFGFMESPNISRALILCRRHGLKFDIMATSFYLGRRKVIADTRSALPNWQNRLFIALANASADPTDYFDLPANRVIELGSHVSV
ncbi:potassium transporter Kup [Pararhizobium mangrovi]|uniref:Probable potassium transport system protein Kup n=1 Tax=Pararhizobium mangrovi TaxID=2590452 RepID=A0A506UC07_9HYPH|nr:potassium transporter Kup [Pararhizobium mangrovi]TPW30651.1 potassium transporter Kup [Pararhizobium mangrovi]